MWLAESARAQGIGCRLLAHLAALARDHSSHEARIETSDVLPEALAPCRSAGYVEVLPFNDEPFADRWFTKPLLDQGDAVRDSPHPQFAGCMTRIGWTDRKSGFG